MRRSRGFIAAALAALTVGAGSVAFAPAAEASYTQIDGDGSSWAANAINAWIGNVKQYGLKVTYNPEGSTTGRNKFKDDTVDFGGSDIPYGINDTGVVDGPPTNRGYGYMMDVAGGTAFMYNLKIGATRVTNLRLSGETIAKIFTGVITRWNDPAIARDNPALRLPAIKIIPVVRSDGSGATAHFSEWMIATQDKYWTAYCAKSHRSPCTETSAYPVVPGSGMVAQFGDNGVAGYTAQSQSVGAIGYVQYSYALNAGFPVAKMLNAAGYYTEPTAGHVAVALLKAKINLDKNSPTYLAQDLSDVYTNTDRRAYPLSNYSYLVVPTTTTKRFSRPDQGETLGAFGNYLLCQGQNQANAIGYSALPINLVQAGLDQLSKVPGSKVAPSTDRNALKGCRNPTFSADGSNTLARNDPFPPACDKEGPTQCLTGTGGAKHQATPGQGGTAGSNGSANGSGQSGSSGGSGSGGSSGGSGSGGPASGSGAGPSAQTNGRAHATETASGGAGTSSSAAACDPDSGTCPDSEAAGSTGSQQGIANPQNAAASLGDGLQVTLMALAAVLLLGLALGPPLVAQLSSRRRGRE